MPRAVDLRDSVDSVDSVDMDKELLPLLERLGIDTHRLGRTSPSVVDLSQSDNEETEERESDEVVYIIDRFGCVLIDDDTDEEDVDIAEDWRIPTSTMTVSATRTTYIHKTPEPERLALARAMYRKYNALIFDNALPLSLDISWNKKLSSTAGLTHYTRRIEHAHPVYSCRIELATKVLDTTAKLERTLIHEMCHCAAWMIDHVAKPPHGESFKKYARRAMAVLPGIDVSTCHNYDIFYAYRWACTTCGVEYGRHSKSIDVEKKVCGGCRGRLEYAGKFRRDAHGETVAVSRSPEKKVSGYSAFVKEHFHRVKIEMEGPDGRRGHGVLASEVMKKLAAEWAVSKENHPANPSLAHSLLS